MTRYIGPEWLSDYRVLTPKTTYGLNFRLRLTFYHLWLLNDTGHKVPLPLIHMTFTCNVAVTWLKYFRYGVKLYPISQSTQVMQ